MIFDMADMDTPPRCRDDSGAGELLAEAGHLAGAAILLVAVAVLVEVADVLKVAEEFRGGRW